MEERTASHSVKKNNHHTNKSPYCKENSSILNMVICLYLDRSGENKLFKENSTKRVRYQ